MSEKIGNSIPPPLRFEMGAEASPGEIVRSLLLVTVDEDGAPRVALLAPTEVKALDEHRVEVRVGAGFTTARNLERGATALLWCVLDGAAYSLRGTVSPGRERRPGEHASFVLTLSEILKDFYPTTPMVAGPTFRRM